MATELWLNLPVKDLNRSKEFFKALGFKFHPRHEGSNDAAGLVFGSTIVMLFPENTFKQFSRHDVADTAAGSEILISIDAQSPAEVDELAGKAAEAGGHVFGKPAEIQGFMYGCGFSDPDGHRWNVLYYDRDKM